MKFLLDTHTLLWQLNEPEKLTDAVRNIISFSEEDISVSIASLWEIAIKAGLGRLQLNTTFDEMQRVFEKYQIRILNIYLHHLDFYKSLPFIHKDPFDRILIAQAMSEGYTIITKDTMIPNIR